MSEPSSLLKGLQVLVVDDRVDDCSLITLLLEAYQVQVETVYSVQEALDYIRNSPIDALISDIAMPGEDGYSLLRRVRQLHPNQGGRMPAIAVTALGTEEAYKQALVAGFQAVLSKPIKFDELTTLLAGLTCSIVGLDTLSLP
ncbi:response regulator [Leptolyngbya sp. NIES-2104]|uniref:response regulator n=1 Tax=Leptolyngbya sp. NIES-2104 TaxID=1552121 RepID=UPI0006ECBEB2|nr:response regulator [Leptolyngbya sp. NIES-2104]GAP94822.1 two-component hybrid sensor and regulator [Leptolyngbya sp. NIES-2104]